MIDGPTQAPRITGENLVGLLDYIATPQELRQQASQYEDMHDLADVYVEKRRALLRDILERVKLSADREVYAARMPVETYLHGDEFTPLVMTTRNLVVGRQDESRETFVMRAADNLRHITDEPVVYVYRFIFGEGTDVIRIRHGSPKLP